MSRKKKKLGRPPTTGSGHPITVRVSREMLLRIDAWRARHPNWCGKQGLPSRPAALRHLAGREM